MRWPTARTQPIWRKILFCSVVAQIGLFPPMTVALWQLPWQMSWWGHNLSDVSDLLKVEHLASCHWSCVFCTHFGWQVFRHCKHVGIMAPSGKSQPKQRTGNPSDPSVTPEMTNACGHDTRKHQFEIGHVCSVQILFGKLTETRVQNWANLGAERQKKSEMGDGAPF